MIGTTNKIIQEITPKLRNITSNAARIISGEIISQHPHIKDACVSITRNEVYYTSTLYSYISMNDKQNINSIAQTFRDIIPNDIPFCFHFYASRSLAEIPYDPFKNKGIIVDGKYKVDDHDSREYTTKDIEEIKKLKQETESKIAALLNDFMTETQLSVESVDITTFRLNPETDSKVINVEMEVKL